MEIQQNQLPNNIQSNPDTFYDCVSRRVGKLVKIKKGETIVNIPEGAMDDLKSHLEHYDPKQHKGVTVPTYALAFVSQHKELAPLKEYFIKQLGADEYKAIKLAQQGQNKNGFYRLFRGIFRS